MAKTAPRELNRRALAALVMVISGACLPVTGLAVHLTQAQPIALERHVWMAAHTGLAVTFSAFALWHAIVNRRPLTNYVHRLASKAPLVSRETAYAAAIVAGVLVVVVGHAFHVR